MDTFVETKLKEWGLSEQLKQQLEANQIIDRTAFESLTEGDIKELIPVLGFRKKIISKYQEEQLGEAISHPLIFSVSEIQSDTASTSSTVTAISSPASSISYITDTEAECIQPAGLSNENY
ncbi:unnamed protein product [Ceutorhynchus assimilis]|uniref:SAM domain-containing protein n=1 Tax=Ceutorhynchus assimilis TaxID=467358 RepID=A0A9N9MAN8_9CUCU|nr:unnamed protein product [Ceutorhynchus assimilis]